MYICVNINYFEMGSTNRLKRQQRSSRRRNTRRHSGRSQHSHNRPAPYTGQRGTDNSGWEKYKEQQLAQMPPRLPRDHNKKLINVFVEGYEDVAFWRGIFDNYESSDRTFEINVPPRADLAKGKQVIMSMLKDSSPETLLCIDSDFDYLFGDTTTQSKTINNSPYMFHTYAYATENFLCYAPSLHNVCVKSTKNDARIFDFEKFLADYSRVIYPLFLWYAYSAQMRSESVFTLLEFRGSVKLNYLEVKNNGENTLSWLERQVSKRLEILSRRHPGWDNDLAQFEHMLINRGVTPENTYLYMQGHTLMDNVVLIMLNAVCEQLKLMSNIRISTSTKTGIALRNEMSNYNNALRNVREILLDNETYKECPLYKKLQQDIESYLTTL